MAPQEEVPQPQATAPVRGAVEEKVQGVKQQAGAPTVSGYKDEVGDAYRKGRAPDWNKRKIMGDVAGDKADEMILADSGQDSMEDYAHQQMIEAPINFRESQRQSGGDNFYPMATRDDLERVNVTDPEEQGVFADQAQQAQILAGDRGEVSTLAVQAKKAPPNPVLQGAAEAAEEDMRTGGVLNEWGKEMQSGGVTGGRDLTQWLEVMGNRHEEWEALKNTTYRNTAQELRFTRLNAFFENERGQKAWKAAQDALNIFARSYKQPLGKSIIHALEQSLYRDYVHEIAPIIRKAMIEAEAEKEMEVLVKAMEAEKTHEMSEIKKSLDEIAKAFDAKLSEMKKALDAIPELKKSMDELQKDSEDVTNVLIWFDDRLASIEKAKKDEDEDEEDEDEEMPPVKKFAEGVPKSPNGMSSDTDAPVMKGKQNDIDQNSKEDAGLKGAKPQKLTSGKSSMEVHVAENQKLVKSFEEGKKVGEIEAMKKAADSSDIGTPLPGAVAEPTRRLEPLAKADQDLMNMSWGKIERLHREGKL
jgi:hypothetical protein